MEIVDVKIVLLVILLIKTTLVLQLVVILPIAINVTLSTFSCVTVVPPDIQLTPTKLVALPFVRTPSALLVLAPITAEPVKPDTMYLMGRALLTVH